jgi:hypothetical protein
MSEGEQVAEVIHYYDRISVAVVKLSQPVRIGDNLHFLGRRTDFRQVVASMQVDHQPVEASPAGTEVALKVDQRVLRGDKVFRL